MNIKNSLAINRIAIILVVLAVTLILVGLFAVNYFSGTFFLLSLFLAWPVKSLFKIIDSKVGWIGRSLSFVTLLLIFYSLWQSYQVRLYGPCGTIYACMARYTPFKEYTIRIKTLDSTSGEFDVAASVVYDKSYGMGVSPFATDDFETQLIEIPSEQVYSTSEGFLLRTVVIPGPDRKQVALVSSSGQTRAVDVCYYNCPDIKVELIDFPKGTFYQAKNSQDLRVFEFGNTMSASWTIFGFENSHGDIAFNYLPVPLNLLLPILRPLIGISSLSEWLVGVIGLIGGIVLTVVGKPVLDIAKNCFETGFKGKLMKRPPQKATFIVSSKGEEKEIKRKR